MKLKILTPEKLVLEKDVDSVTMPGRAGQLTALAGHDIMATELAAGRLYFKWSDEDRRQVREDYDTGGGFAEITGNRAEVFVSFAAKVTG